MYLANAIYLELKNGKRFKFVVAEYFIRGEEIDSIPSNLIVEVNTIHRVANILGGNSLVDKDSKFVDTLLHFIGYLDIECKLKSDLIKEKIIDRLSYLSSYKIVEIFTQTELEAIITNYIYMKNASRQLDYFLLSINIVIKDFRLFFDIENDKYILSTGVNYNENIKSKIDFIIELFFDFASDISIYWGEIGILDTLYSPILDKTLIYSEG